MVKDIPFFDKEIIPQGYLPTKAVCTSTQRIRNLFRHTIKQLTPKTKYHPFGNQDAIKYYCYDS